MITPSNDKEMPMTAKKEIPEKKETSESKPDDFESKIEALMANCTQEQCDFVKEKCQAREDELEGEDGEDVTMDDYEEVAKGEE